MVSGKPVTLQLNITGADGPAIKLNMAAVTWAYIHDEPRDIASASLSRAGHEEHRSHYHREYERPQPELPFSDHYHRQRRANLL